MWTTLWTTVDTHGPSWNSTWAGVRSASREHLAAVECVDPVLDVIARLTALLSQVDDIIAMALAAAAMNDAVRQRAGRLIANANAQRVRLTQLISTMRAARGP